jgi:hypothetical protein
MGCEGLGRGGVVIGVVRAFHERAG